MKKFTVQQLANEMTRLLAADDITSLPEIKRQAEINLTKSTSNTATPTQAAE